MFHQAESRWGPSKRVRDLSQLSNQTRETHKSGSEP